MLFLCRPELWGGYIITAFADLSIDCKIVVKLPLAYKHPEGIPLSLFACNKSVVSVVAEHLLNKAVFLHGNDSLVKAAGEVFNAEGISLLLCGLKEVYIYAVRCRQISLDTVKDCGKAASKRKVWVSGRVGAPQLDTGACAS